MGLYSCTCWNFWVYNYQKHPKTVNLQLVWEPCARDEECPWCDECLDWLWNSCEVLLRSGSCNTEMGRAAKAVSVKFPGQTLSWTWLSFWNNPDKYLLRLDYTTNSSLCLPSEASVHYVTFNQFCKCMHLHLWSLVKSDWYIPFENNFSHLETTSVIFSPWSNILAMSCHVSIPRNIVQFWDLHATRMDKVMPQGHNWPKSAPQKMLNPQLVNPSCRPLPQNACLSHFFFHQAPLTFCGMLCTLQFL